MKKLISILIFSLLVNSNSVAETILLKCEYIDGKLQRYEDNKLVKEEKPVNPDKEYEIQLDPVLKIIKEGPWIGYGTEVLWRDDWVIWQSDSTVAGSMDVLVIFSLDRVTGKLTRNFKSLDRVIENGKYQKDSNGNWIRNMKWQSTNEYQCKVEERLF